MIHDESIDALPTIECDYAEIKMAGDTTPIRVPLVYESSTGYFGGTDVDRKKVVVGVLLQNGWLSGWIPLLTNEK